MDKFDDFAKLKKSSLVSEEGLRFLAEQDGVNPELVCTVFPRWAESAPKTPDAISALVRCDLILRSDGSVVFLDGIMGGDSRELAHEYMQGITNPNNLPWTEWAASVTELPEPQ